MYLCTKHLFWETLCNNRQYHIIWYDALFWNTVILLLRTKYISDDVRFFYGPGLELELWIGLCRNQGSFFLCFCKGTQRNPGTRRGSGLALPTVPGGSKFQAHAVDLRGRGGLVSVCMSLANFDWTLLLDMEYVLCKRQRGLCVGGNKEKNLKNGTWKLEKQGICKHMRAAGCVSPLTTVHTEYFCEYAV